VLFGPKGVKMDKMKERILKKFNGRIVVEGNRRFD
jgi:hypothetical protein